MRRVLQAVSLAVLFACSGVDGGGTSITEPPHPVPGVLSLSLTTPNSDDRAILVTISGPAGMTNLIGGSSGYRAEFRLTGTTVRAAVFGNLTNGVLLRFSVPDVAKTSSYSASVIEVSDPSNALRTDLSTYALSIGTQ